jgi:hypothetical protein
MKGRDVCQPSFSRRAIDHWQFTQNVVEVIVYCFWAIVLDDGNFPLGQTFCNTTQDFWFASDRLLILLSCVICGGNPIRNLLTSRLELF